MNANEFYYHWTHRDNVPSILTNGLDPNYSRGKLKSNWFCDFDKVAWALKHVSDNHGWSADELVLIRFPKEHTPYASTAWFGVYTGNKVIRLKSRSAVKAGILAEWVPSVTLRKNTARTAQTHPDTCMQDRGQVP